VAGGEDVEGCLALIVFCVLCLEFIDDWYRWWFKKKKKKLGGV